MAAVDRAHAVEVYKKLHANVDSMGKTLLKYLRHPEVTADQAEAARQQYLSVYQSWIDTRIKLRERFPQPTGTRGLYQKELPWNTSDGI